MKINVIQRDQKPRKHAEVHASKGHFEIKKISSWAAIIFAPTLVGTIYGMNFENMPELSLPFGYPLALLAMLGFAVGLFGIFKYKKWL